MSSSLLSVIQVELNRYEMYIILILGDIGNVLNVFMFKNHLKNSCAMYLMIASLMNIFLLTFNIPTFLYAFYYNDPTSNSIILCKLRYYLTNIWGQMGRYFVALACIDRFALTTIHVRFRRFTQLSKARYFIVLISIFWSIVPIHSLIMVTIVNGRCGTFGIYSILYNIYILIFAALIPPIIMIIFGYLTYRNIKQLHTRVQPIRNNNVGDRQNFTVNRRDRQLFIMVIVEISVYVITMSLYPLILFEMMITNYMNINKSLVYIQFESFIYSIAILLSFANNAAPFYIYLFASNTFRQDFKQLFNQFWITIIQKILGNVHRPRTLTQAKVETHF